MLKYKSLTRTTISGLEDTPYAGVYILAYMGKILYVGKSNYGVVERIKSHINNADHDDVGGWLWKVKSDWHNVRLDILEAPDDIEIDYWLRYVESEMVRKFKPLFNEQLIKST